MAIDTNTKTWVLDNGKELTIRHIRADDAAIEQAFVRKLSAQSRYMRFHGTIKELNERDLVIFTNPDPLKSEAMIILHKGENGEEEIGVARFTIDPDGTGCEFAIVIADEWQRRGLGKELMQALISRAKSRGVKRIYGSVLKDNGDMLQFVKGLGFESVAIPGDSSAILINKYLSE
jgi:acetyltransferase